MASPEKKPSEIYFDLVLGDLAHSVHVLNPRILHRYELPDAITAIIIGYTHLTNGGRAEIKEESCIIAAYKSRVGGTISNRYVRDHDIPEITAITENKAARHTKIAVSNIQFQGKPKKEVYLYL